MGKKQKKSKYSKLLTPEQRHQYELFGEPDESQNWLELFSPNVMSDLKTIMHCCSDNQKKSDYVSSELGKFGFQDVGLGTNILTMSNPYYPGVVFKIALDEFGIADNFNDCILSDYVPKYNRVFARDPGSIISVQERCVKPTAQQMDILEPRILELLQELRKHFLIADLSIDNFLNYGITRGGDFRIIDGSDLYPLSQMSEAPTCHRIVGEHRHTGELKYCEGKLHYTDDFKWLKCDKCGKEILPLEARPRKDVSKMSDYLRDGFSAEERALMASEEIAVIRAAHPELYPVEAQDTDEVDTRQEPRTIFVYPDTESEVSSDQADDEDDDEVIDSDSDTDEFGFTELHRTPDSFNDTEDEDSNPVEGGVVPNDSHSSGRSVSMAIDDGPVRTTGDSEPIDNELSLEDLLNNGDDTVVTRAVGMLSTKLISALDNMKSADNEIVQDAFMDVIADALGVSKLRLGNFLNPPDEDCAKDEATDRENDRDDAEEQADETPSELTVEHTIEYIRRLKTSSDPADVRELLKIEAVINDSVETENINSDIRGEDSDENSEPHITYRLIKDAEGDINAIPSIELSIHGDPDEAYDESGMPITITLDAGKTIYLAATAYQIKDLIQHAIDDAKADMIECNHFLVSSDADDSDEEDTDQDPE